jgi:hypothetical protein
VTAEAESPDASDLVDSSSNRHASEYRRRDMVDSCETLTKSVAERI